MPGVSEASRSGVAGGAEQGELRRMVPSPPSRLLPATGGVAIDPMLWKDEEMMKRELVAWAKAVALNSFRSSKQHPHE
ncbi:unnamed protein product [Spirodela intermedia]|uniref:Uncharacterized protein n=1 Tax=Spirodela intermedia TaxID=51605 RepID=A0A7I8KT19_SPIIN|nr:unnamed protein product [Spirodela intermedia]